MSYLLVFWTNMWNNSLRDFSFALSSVVISIGVSLGHEGFRINNVKSVSFKRWFEINFNVVSYNFVVIKISNWLNYFNFELFTFPIFCAVNRLCNRRISHLGSRNVKNIATISSPPESALIAAMTGLHPNRSETSIKHLI